MKPFPRSLAVFVAGMATMLLALLGLLAGCASSLPPGADAPLEEYRAALARAREVSSTPEARRQGLERWKDLLSEFSEENLSGKAARVYAGETFFNDTLKTLRGAEEIEAYLLETAAMLESGTVEFLDTVETAQGDVYARWEMVYRGKKLAGGEPIRTIGMSHLRFDEEGKVILHQDFWDSARGIFEHVPVVGGQVRFLKNRF